MKISSHHFLMTSGSYCPCRYSYLLYIKKVDVMDYTHFQKIGVTAFFFFSKDTNPFSKSVVVVGDVSEFLQKAAQLFSKLIIIRNVS